MAVVVVVIVVIAVVQCYCLFVDRVFAVHFMGRVSLSLVDTLMSLFPTFPSIPYFHKYSLCNQLTSYEYKVIIIAGF